MSLLVRISSAYFDNVLSSLISVGSVDGRVLKEQVRAALEGGKSQSISAFLTSLIIFLYFHLHLREPMAAFWFLIICIHLCVRMLTMWLSYRLSDLDRDVDILAKRFVFLAFTSGVVWALMSWMLIPKNDLAVTFALIMTLMSICVVSTFQLSVYRPAVFAFLLPMGLIPIAALIWQRQTELTYLAFGVALHTLAVLKFSLKQNAMLASALEVRFEKEDLAQQLTVQVNLVEQVSKEKTRFFAAANHDLRQPLHSLGLFSSALLTRLKSTPDEAIAQNMVNCVDVLENSFSAMLDISKLDSGVVESKPQPLALSTVFRRLSASFAQQALSQGLDLRFRAGGKWAVTDPTLLERLLGNLIHNALKFTQSGGIVVVARTIYRSNGTQISVEVWDTGVGISNEELPYVFDEFRQGYNSDRDRAKGLGIGLAIVNRLAILMRHKVQAQSRQGSGSVFKVLVPATTERFKLGNVSTEFLLTPATSISFRQLQNLRVLVVDDEEDVRESTSVALRLHGIHVEIADSIAQAEHTVRALIDAGHTLDAVITDFRLRGSEDGISLVLALRHSLGSKVPALLITGDTAPERVRQAQQSGLKVLYKPVKISVMLDELIAIVQRSDKS
jgi:signal transduction histidine kinase/ActR/RegA family two-component response regulator